MTGNGAFQVGELWRFWSLFDLLQISDWSGGINRRFIHHLASRHIRPDARIIAQARDLLAALISRVNNCCH